MRQHSWAWLQLQAKQMKTGVSVSLTGLLIFALVPLERIRSVFQPQIVVRQPQHCPPRALPCSWRQNGSVCAPTVSVPTPQLLGLDNTHGYPGEPVSPKTVLGWDRWPLALPGCRAEALGVEGHCWALGPRSSASVQAS